MKKIIESLKQTFESSCSRTPQYLTWHRMFKREFTKFLLSKGALEVKIGKPNHFDVSGFFRMPDSVFYFRIEDLRWSKDCMLIRTAKDFTDFTGGTNRYASLKSEDEFLIQFNTAIHIVDY